MLKTWRKKDYDTEAMTVVAKVNHSYYGDPAGYEEVLFVAEDGLYFLYQYGGADSPYPTEKLTNIAKKKAKVWPEEA